MSHEGILQLTNSGIILWSPINLRRGGGQKNFNDEYLKIFANTFPRWFKVDFQSKMAQLFFLLVKGLSLFRGFPAFVIYIQWL